MEKGTISKFLRRVLQYEREKPLERCNLPYFSSGFLKVILDLILTITCIV